MNPNIESGATAPRPDAGIELLMCLASHVQGASPATLAADTGSNVPVVRRRLNRLERLGYVEPDPIYPGRVRLSDRMAGFGLSGRYVEMRRLARPHLRRLHEAVGTPVTLHVNTGVAQAAIERYPFEPSIEERERELRQFGDPVPLRFGSTAKVILAFLPEAEALSVLKATESVGDDRNDAYGDRTAWKRAAPSLEELHEIRMAGYAVSLGERSKNGRAMSAPVRERGGSVCAAICLYGARDLVTDERFFAASSLLIEEAAILSTELGYVPEG